MCTKMLIALDGSKTAEKVLPYGRFLAEKLELPVEFVSVVDIGEVPGYAAVRKTPFDKSVEDAVRAARNYLEEVVKNFPGPTKFAVEKGRAERVIIERAAADKGTLIAMATHGHSGLSRWLLGSVTEKVLTGTTNPLLLIKATEGAKTEREVTLQSIVVPLDGSDLAECVLPTVVEIAKRLRLEVILFRACVVPYSPFGGAANYRGIIDELLGSIKGEARAYLEKKIEELKCRGIEKISYVLNEGHSADQIIAFGKRTKNNLIAMCAHGKSAAKRRMLGSIAETVVRHSGDPVLIIRQ